MNKIQCLKCLAMCIQLWIFTSAGFSAAYFEFLHANINGGVLTAEENTTVEISVILKNATCDTPGSCAVRVTHKKKPVCILVHSDRGCKPSDGTVYCSCDTRLGHYNFKKIVNRYDNTHWIWSTFESQTQSTLEFIITYPAHVTNLTVNGLSSDLYPVFTQRSQLIQIVCSWKNGNPPTRVVLLNKYGTQLKTASNGETLYYTLSTGHCWSHENISCHAEGSDRDLFASFIVKCTPVFGVFSVELLHVNAGQTIDFHFPVEADEITECKISRYSEQLANSSRYKSFTSMPEITYLCDLTTVDVVMTTADSNSNILPLYSNASEQTCSCLINGTVPNLTLSIYMHHVSKKDGGRWQVTVSNSEGNSSADVILHFSLVSSSSRVISNMLMILLEFAYLVSGNHIQQNTCKYWSSNNTVLTSIKKEALCSKPNCNVQFTGSTSQEDKTLATLHSLDGNWTLDNPDCHLEERGDTLTILCPWPTEAFDLNDIHFNCFAPRDLVNCTFPEKGLLTCDKVPTTTLPHDVTSGPELGKTSLPSNATSPNHEDSLSEGAIAIISLCVVLAGSLCIGCIVKSMCEF